MRLIDLTGQRFGRLVVVERAETKWLCKCDCGNTKAVLGGHLRSGDIKSCGCLQNEQRTKHGMRNTRVYKIWCAMKERCYYKTHKDFKNYGGRGIIVCDEWKENFQAFYDWAMSNGYEENLTIDRIEVNGNYEPSNCRWASCKDQNNNRSNNHILILKNESHTITEWSRITGIPLSTIKTRINSGWTIEKALTKKRS